MSLSGMEGGWAGALDWKARLEATEAQLVTKPSVVTYARLEPIGSTSGDLGPGLQALLGDPLWLVGRQWQLDELRAEDGGSPVLATLHAEHAPVTRFHPGRRGDDPVAGATDVAPGQAVEVLVEAEPVDVLPERVRAQLGMQLLRTLRRSGIPAGARTAAERELRAVWPFDGPTDAERDPDGTARRGLLAGRVPDGARAAAATRLPDRVRDAVPEAHRATLAEVFREWRAWAQAYVAGPSGTAWDPHRLEYSFEVQASLSTGEATLRAPEYLGGTLDWSDVDAVADAGLGAPAAEVDPVEVHQQVLPAPVRYPGMPGDRLWAFEDAAVHLGGVQAASTDLARLALVELALVFGVDWWQVPLVLPYGSVARVHSLTVTDTFGETVDVAPVRDTAGAGWAAFQHVPVSDTSALADLLYLPATLRHVLEGPPLEEVALFRDEMANLVWGVERVVQGPTGEPVRRGLVESRTLRQQLPGDLGDAQLVYRLMTPVPDHWVPFVSVPAEGVPRTQGATELERRPMVRFTTEGASVVHPQGVLLRADPGGDVAADRLRLAEEEVPRDGVVVTRRFQLARTADGGTVLWVGRRKQAGRGEGASGLRFDTALPPGGL